MSPRFGPLPGFAAVRGGGHSPPRALSHGEDTADLILSHGVFYPRPAAGRVEGSLAVRGGRIVYLGPDAGADALCAARATRVIDLAGRAVTPGLIDAHSHLGGLGEALEEVDLVGAATYDEVVRAGARGGPRRCRRVPGCGAAAGTRTAGRRSGSPPTRRSPRRCPTTRSG